MVINLEISGHEWYSAGKNALGGGRESFNNFLRDYIGARMTSFNDCDRIKFELPTVLTKSDRYNIHKLSIAGEFSGNSYDFGGERVMELKLSKNYVEELMVNYQFRNDFVVDVEPEVVEKTDKQLLFDTMINFIELNLQNEFQEFLKKI